MYVVLVFVVCLFTRRLIAGDSPPAFDTFGHLYYAKKVREMAVAPWGTIVPNVWKAKSVAHPYLWHWIVGRFHLETTLRFEKWINPAIDALFAVFLYILVNGLIGDSLYAFYGALLYIYTPNWFTSINIGPRTNHLTPRLVSEIVVNLFFICLFLYATKADGFYFFLACAFSGLIFLLSKFGIQAVVMISTGLSIATLDFAPISAVALGFIFVLIISRGKIMLSLSEQFSHLIFYFRRNWNNKMSASSRNLFFTQIKNAGSLKRAFYKIFEKNSYVTVIFKLPIVLSVFCMFLYYIYQPKVMQLDMSAAFEFLCSLFLVGLLLFFLINCRALLFLGEAERYINHISVLVIVLCLQLAIDLHLMVVVYGLIIYGFSFWVLELILNYSRRQGRQVDSVSTYLIERLRNLDSPKTILCIPYHAPGVYRILLQTQHNVLFPMWAEDNARDRFVELYEYKYPYIDPSKLGDIMKTAAFDFLIISPRACSGVGLSLLGFPSVGLTRVWDEIDDFEVYERA